MIIVVLLKSVPDTASVLKITEDNKSIITDNLKYIMNPYDEYALEEAVKLRENIGGEVVAVSMGDNQARQIIRAALAVGADSAILIKSPSDDLLSCKGVAKALASAVSKLSPDIIFAGKQAVDDDASQVPERIAELLGIPHASVVTRFELEDNKVTADCEMEGGYYTLELFLPALITVQKGINTPRYPTLPNIMKAKFKEIKEMTLADLGLHVDEIASRLTVDLITLFRQERLTKILGGGIEFRVKHLVSILHEKEMML